MQSLLSHDIQTCGPQEQSSKALEWELAKCAIVSTSSRRPLRPPVLQICATHVLDYISC